MSKSESSVFLGVVLGYLALGILLAFGDPVIPTPTSTPAPGANDDAFKEIQKAVGKNVVSLAQQENGIIWIGTEGAGVFRYDEHAVEGHRVTKFDQRTGLGDNDVYALCVDKQNRVWVGQLNHGVSVFNGKEWQNYDVLKGPIGEHIYDMISSPKDGAIWMATSAGITRYDPNTDSWRSFTMEDGLPENQATCLACDPRNGDVLIGFKTKGLSIARASENFTKWTTVPFSLELTRTPDGTGLPTGMINDVLITKAGVYCTATTQGLSWSVDRGLTWKYQRGKDWAEKLRLLTDPIPGFKMPAKSELVRLIPEDYVATIVEKPDTMLALGFWNKGLVSFDLKTLTSTSIYLPKINNNNSDYINRLLILKDGRVLSSIYGSGIYVDSVTTPSVTTPAPNSIDTINPIALPSPEISPDIQAVTALRDRLIKDVGNINAGRPAPMAVFLGEDWRTEGRQLGRYGRYSAIMCAMLSPSDYIWGAGDEPLLYRGYISKHHSKGDSLRYWIHNLATTRSGSLEMPPSYMDGRVWRGFNTWAQDRRQSEWDDHGEAYSREFDGPHVRCNIRIPSGQFVLSCYNINKDGQGGANRFRDFRVTLREQTAPLNFLDPDFAAEPELSATRTLRFSGGGVYSSWLVHGPITLTIEINRNYSFNTLLAGVFLDKADELPAPYLETWSDYHNAANEKLFESAHYAHSEDLPANLVPAVQSLECLRKLEAYAPDNFEGVERKAYILIAKYLQTEDLVSDRNSPQALRECLYHLQMFEQWEKLVQDEFGKTPRSIEKSVRLQEDLEGNKHGREMIERFAGYSAIRPKLGVAKH
jgi:hypothetical protein